jgi:uncharacterized membrane protein YhaH (DUF805 family)
VKRKWFPAKRYGWGWGIPQTWQGWVVMLVYLAAIAYFSFLFATEETSVSLSLYLLQVIILTSIMILICYLTGEKPEWRWGDKKKRK